MKVLPVAMTAAIVLGLMGCSSEPESVTKFNEAVTKIEQGLDKCDGKTGADVATCLEPLQKEFLTLSTLQADLMKDVTDAKDIEELNKRAMSLSEKIMKIAENAAK